MYIDGEKRPTRHIRSPIPCFSLKFHSVSSHVVEQKPQQTIRFDNNQQIFTTLPSEVLHIRAGKLNVIRRGRFVVLNFAR